MFQVYINHLNQNHSFLFNEIRVEELEKLVQDKFGLLGFQLLQGNNRPATEFTDNGFPYFLKVNIPTLGGKGGFGSVLKAKGAKMASQKTTNFDSCRDLNGRRLKTLDEARRLADYIEKEPERKKQQKDKIEKKIKEGLKTFESKKVVIKEDEKFEKVYEENLTTISNALDEGCLLLILALKRNKQSQKPKKKISAWDSDKE
ncbi:hypothetical protein HDV06_004473 [Boothiomyces sp. JEL0866]|nr:hypothetical protein HDV06_004473 [Boothiomyces sp. JEL0866]